MPPSHPTIAEWLERLAADRLIALSAQTVIDVERLLDVLSYHHVQNLEEIGHCLTSLLAKDEERYHQVLEHFRRTFVQPRAPEVVERRVGSQRPAQAPPLSPWARYTPRAPDPRREGLLRRWLPSINVRATSLVLATTLAVLLAIGILGLRYALRPTATRANSALGELAALLPQGAQKLPAVEPAAEGPHLEIVQDAKRNDVSKSQARAPDLTSRPGPPWRRWLLFSASAILAVVAARWWLADLEFTKDKKALEKESEENRVLLMKNTSMLGVPYHVERVPPMPLGAIDDAATLLGRIARREEGLELDILPTIHQTIDAGGRLMPVFCPDGRREALLVFVDIETDGHPYLEAVEWVLARWKQVGLSIVRYDYNERPDQLLRHPDHRPILLNELARRTEGMPLLILSRLAFPQDIHGGLDWLRALSPWPNRALLDLDPRLYEERREDGRQILDRIAYERLLRYPFTPTGVLACAAALAGGGQARRSPRMDALKSAADPAVEEALRRWAAAACIVPDPSWAHLDSLRRELPEIRDVLSDARSIQRLIDWVLSRGYGKGLVGFGSSLRFTKEARIELISELRLDDKKRWPTATEERLETRARRFLLRQMEAAAAEGEGAFQKEKRAMKMAVHRAVIGETRVEQLLEDFRGEGVGRELLELLEELVAINDRVDGRTPSVGGWSPRQLMVVRAMLDGHPRVRLSDMVSLRRWTPSHWKGVGAALAVIGLSVGGWWIQNAPIPREVTPATWKVVGVESAPEPPKPDLVALAESAPMRFVRLPGGRFQMGSPKEERDEFLKGLSKELRDVYEDEVRHSAEVGPFEISIHEVTQKQWTLVMTTKPFDCRYGCGDDLPAQNVSWFDAVKFMNELTDLENKTRSSKDKLTPCYQEKGEAEWVWDRTCTGYRLPTETEWEYAARAGTGTAFSFGDDSKKLCEYANGADQAGKRKYADWTWTNDACDDKFADLAPVGRFKANPWGLYDMHGNVWEWVWDWYGDYRSQTERGYSGPESGSLRVLRGGSFGYKPGDLRSALRLRFTPSVSDEDGGFRCVRGSPSIDH